MVEKMRADIEALGGEIRFEQRVDRPADRRPTASAAGARRDAGHAASSCAADHVVLALGHSARDTFEMLHERGVHMEAKPFSIGFRIEHPQSLIDRARFGPNAGNPILGAADYKLVHHAQQRPLGLQLLHVPGRHGGRGDLRAGPRRHQRHEPVLAQRAQRQRRHRRRHRAARTTGRTAGRRPGQPARRHRLPAPLGVARLRARRRRLRGARRSWSATSSAASARPRSAASMPSYKPGVHLTDLAQPRPRQPARLRDRRDPRGAAGLRAADHGLRDARRGADRRRDAHLVAAAHHARRATSRA